MQQLKTKSIVNADVTAWVNDGEYWAKYLDYEKARHGDHEGRKFSPVFRATIAENGDKSRGKI